jgi:hypothetical protein
MGFNHFNGQKNGENFMSIVQAVSVASVICLVYSMLPIRTFRVAVLIFLRFFFPVLQVWFRRMQSIMSFLARRATLGPRLCFSSSASCRSQEVPPPPPSSSTTVAPAATTTIGRELSAVPRFRTPRLAWVETLNDQAGSSARGMVPLHPSLFADTPDISIVHKNVEWQMKYKNIVSFFTHGRGRIIV